MKLSRIVPMLLTAILAAALLAGCGEPSKADYEKDIEKVGNKVEKDLDALDSGQPTPATLTKATKSLNAAADEIEEITPPSEVEDLHDDLVSALRDTADLLGRMAPLMKMATEDPSKLGEDDLSKMTKISEDFTKIEARMKKVEKGFEDKKYDIGLDTSE